jgi:hypothetical protein
MPLVELALFRGQPARRFSIALSSAGVTLRSSASCYLLSPSKNKYTCEATSASGDSNTPGGILMLNSQFQDSVMRARLVSRSELQCLAGS